MFGSALGSLDVDELAPGNRAATEAILDLQARIRALESEREVLRKQLIRANQRIECLEAERAALGRSVQRLLERLEPATTATPPRMPGLDTRGLPWVTTAPGATTHSLVAHLQNVSHLLRRSPVAPVATSVQPLATCSRFGIHGADEADEALREFSDEELASVRSRLEEEYASLRGRSKGEASAEIAAALERISHQLRVVKRACSRRELAARMEARAGILRDVKRFEQCL